jgi:hypothetical protein
MPIELILFLVIFGSLVLPVIALFLLDSGGTYIDYDDYPNFHEFESNEHDDNLDVDNQEWHDSKEDRQGW